MTYTAQPNDLTGGWIVTTYPYPLSEHDLSPTEHAAVIADCRTEQDAVVIAHLLNQAGQPCPDCAEIVVERDLYRERWLRASAEQTRLSLLVQHARTAAVALSDALPTQQELPL